MGVSYPRRGEVFWVRLDPTVGSEIAKTRPGAVISNDVGNQYSQRLIVAPITSSLGKVYPFEVSVAPGEAGLREGGKILLDQLRSVDKTRLGDRLGALTELTLERVDRALHVSLDLRCPPS